MRGAKKFIEWQNKNPIMHTPNPNNYRMWLGEEVNKALFTLVANKNSNALKELSVTEYVEKMIAHWWKQEFPDVPVPFNVKRYDADLDFVQSG